MRVKVRDELGHELEMASAMPLAVAQKQPLTTERLREQLGRLGGTPFRLQSLRNHLQGEVILPVSELNRLRREVAARLEELWRRPRRWQLNPESAPSLTQIPNDAKQGSTPASEAQLRVLVRSMAQLEAALSMGVQQLYCEFEDPKRYREAVAKFRAWQYPAGSNPEIFVAPPRISKPGEDWILKQVRSSEPDGFLVRNYENLKYYKECRRVGDYSLNVANQLTADYFINHHRLERLTASYDLNLPQLESLLQAAPPEWFEVTLHQHIPMFHMEHCVFCAFLSKGTDYTNCGRPCERHEVKLRDRVGVEHPIKADAGCRNTVFNGTAQTGADYAARFLALGVRHFRVEFLSESPEQMVKTVTRYRQLLRGEITGTQLWRELRLRNQLGVTRGPMEKG